MAEKAWEYGAYDKKDYPLVVRASLGSVFSIIIDHMENMENEDIYSNSFQRDELRIKKSLLFIERNFSGNITLKHIAKSANISESTCLRLYKTVLGVTPIKYLMTFRIKKAAEELIQGNGRSISEIAYSCGFSDASYFNRCFRKEYGSTPSEYIHKNMC